MNNLKVIIISIFLFSSMGLFAQIGGISASKLSTICTCPVAPKTIEFEPYFSYNSYEKVWNDRHVAVDSEFVSSGDLGFRFTYGVFENLETGFYIPANATYLLWGAKYRIINKDFFSFALISGANFDFHEKNPLLELGLGSVVSINYTKNISTDLDFHFIKNLNQKNLINQLFIGMDNGIYIGKVQYIIGLNYIYRDNSNSLMSNNLYLNPGVTIEPANNFLLVLSTPFSVYGLNDIKDYGFSFALTITID